MIALPSDTKVWLAAGVTDLRRGMDGLAALVQLQLDAQPLSGHVFVFRGRRGDLLKVLWADRGTDCACSRSGSSAVGSCGRRPRAARCT